MAEAIYDELIIPQGADFYETYEVTDENGEPVKFAGRQGRMQVKEREGEAEPVLLDLSTANGGIIDCDDNGHFSLFYPRAQVQALVWPVPTAVFDILFILGDGLAHQLVQGKITLDAGVTRL
jgi:hypothetical protein